jgi:RNA polymerase sigma-70 factor (ECF subfamily)
LTRDELITLARARLDAVYRFAHHVAPDPAAVDGLVLETYARAFESPPPPGPGDVGTWLLKLLCGVARARFGIAFDQPTPFERDHAGAALAVAGRTPACYDLSLLDWGRAGDRLEQAVSALPTPYRAVLVLWASERLAHQQIAGVLGLSEAVARARLFRARMIVATELGVLATEWGLEVPAPADV